MYGQEDDYQDDFEQFSEDEVPCVQTPQPRPVPKPQPMSHLNSSLTEFNQTQTQIKNYIKNTTLCARPVNQSPKQQREEQPSTSTGGTSTSGNNSKLDTTPTKPQHNYTDQRSRLYKPPMSLKLYHKQDYPKVEQFKDMHTIFRLNGITNPIIIPSLNNSFQSGQFMRDRMMNKGGKDSRRNSVGINANSHKRIDPQSPRHNLEKQNRPKLTPSTKQVSNRNSQKLPPKQPSQRNVGVVNSYRVDQDPNISAKCWVVVDGLTGMQIAGHNETVQREVASITKIMTCWVSLQLSRKFKINLDDTFFDVSYYASTVGGTTASLCEGDQVSVRDLLYGLMLPSGNDAAVTLAENFGDYQEDDNDEEDQEALAEFRRNKKMNCHHTDYFLSQMNLWAKRFGLSNTYYANPHGLMNDRNKSTAQDVAMLCYRVLRDVLMQKIVSTKIYFSEIIDDEGFSKEIFWENTNKMLYKGYVGVKTGITNKAGPCVVEHYRDDKRNLILVLLNCKSVDERWVDAAKLVDWVKARES